MKRSWNEVVNPYSSAAFVDTSTDRFRNMLRQDRKEQRRKKAAIKDGEDGVKDDDVKETSQLDYLLASVAKVHKEEIAELNQKHDEAVEKIKEDYEKEISKLRSFHDANKYLVWQVDDYIWRPLTHMHFYGSRFKHSELREHDPIALRITELFQETLVRHRRYSHTAHAEKPLIDIMHIHHICNPVLTDLYMAAVRQILAAKGEDQSFPDYCVLDGLVSAPTVFECTPVATYENPCNEFMGFHGCPFELASANTIDSFGFNTLMSGSHFGNMFGPGIYMAANASKADIYTTDDRNGLRYMYLSRCALGHAIDARHAGAHHNYKDRHSVRAITKKDGGEVEYNEYVLLQNNQVLPTYKIAYKHRSECKCTHCM